MRAYAVFAMSLVTFVGGNALGQTEECDRSPTQFRCEVLDITPSGNHLLVAQVRLSDGSMQLFIRSQILDRQYRTDLGRVCQYISEVGYVCYEVGNLLSARFVESNRLEFARIDYERAQLKSTLCGRKVPLDYNDGPVVGDIRFLREMPNESETAGEFLFSGDPALRTTYEVNRVLVKTTENSNLISLRSPYAFDGSRFLYRWQPVNRFEAWQVSNVRFGTVTCVSPQCGSVSIFGVPNSGPTQALIVDSQLGSRVFQGKGSPELVVLPNGTVDSLVEFLCAENPGLDPRPTSER